MVNIIVDNVYSKIVGFLPDEVQKELDSVLSYRVPEARHMPSFKRKQWDGRIRLYYRSRGQSFFTGLLSFVRKVLDKHKIQYTKTDDRKKPLQNLPDLKFIPPSDFEDRPYQELTIKRSQLFTRGVLEICTGGGKTLIATRIISELKTYPVVFYVLTKDLMEQAYGVLSSCLNEPIGRIGDGDIDIKKINVCTIQTAIRALNMENTTFKINDYQFDDEDEWDEKTIDSADKNKQIQDLIRGAKVIFVDECHHVGAKCAREVLTASVGAYWRFGCSATPIREDNATILIQAMFGAKIVDINASYLIKMGDLVKPYIFMEQIDSAKDFHSYQKIYENCIVKNNEFNDHVARTVNHLVSRKLSVLVLVQQYKHGEYLKAHIPNSEFITGKLSSEKRLDYIDRLRRGEITLIATSLADEGLDVRGLDAVVVPSGGKSQTRILQRIGRALRKDKKSAKQKDRAIVVLYEHNARFLNKHAKRVRSIISKEPEFVIVDSKGPDFIIDDIDRVMGLKQTNSLFEV